MPPETADSAAESGSVSQPLPHNATLPGAATACDAYCNKHAACRLLNDQPVHYFDCERFNVTDYGTRQGKCDCTATADLNEVLDAAYTAGYRQSVEDNR